MVQKRRYNKNCKHQVKALRNPAGAKKNTKAADPKKAKK